MKTKLFVSFKKVGNDEPISMAVVGLTNGVDELTRSYKDVSEIVGKISSFAMRYDTKGMSFEDVVDKLYGSVKSTFYAEFSDIDYTKVRGQYEQSKINNLPYYKDAPFDRVTVDGMNQALVKTTKEAAIHAFITWLAPFKSKSSIVEVWVEDVESAIILDNLLVLGATDSILPKRTIICLDSVLRAGQFACTENITTLVSKEEVGVEGNYYNSDAIYSAEAVRAVVQKISTENN